MVSYIASRRGYPSWWNDEDREAADKVNTQTLPAYYKAKVDADEHLAALAHKRGKGFQAINLRPGTLTDDKATGQVSLGKYCGFRSILRTVLIDMYIGKTSARGKVTREDVAKVAAALLERDDVEGWYDLLNGDEDIDAAVDRLAKQGWDAMQDGEDLDRIYGLAK